MTRLHSTAIAAQAIPAAPRAAAPDGVEPGAAALDLVALLPHRPPMRLLDAAAMLPGLRLVSRARLPGIDDGAGGLSRWPRAALVEAMAQTTAVWLLSRRGGLAQDELPLLGAVECRFVRPLRPAMLVSLETVRLTGRGGRAIFAVIARDEERRLIARARIAAAIVPCPVTAAARGA